VSVPVRITSKQQTQPSLRRHGEGLLKDMSFRIEPAREKNHRRLQDSNEIAWRLPLKPSTSLEIKKNKNSLIVL